MQPEPKASTPPPGGAAIFLTFLKLGTSAFGGPAMMARIGAVAIKERGWLSPEDFKAGIALAQLIPGATAMQVAAYVGLRVGGPVGAATAFVGFGLPAFLLMLGLSWAYEAGRAMPVGEAVFQGVGAIVVALVAHAAVTFGRSWIRCWQEAAIALAVCLGYLLGVTPFLAIPLAGVAGVALLRGDGRAAFPSVRPIDGRKAWRAALGIAGTAAAMVAVLMLSGHQRLADLAMVMARIDLFAFGGGFAALPLMNHEVVEVRQWLDARAFLDGIGLGQVTPGPIVITATFVGFLLSGVSGAVVGTVAIFLPSFLALLATAPLLDRLRRSRWASSALLGVSASATGLIAALAVRLAEAHAWSAPSVGLAFAAFAAFAALLAKAPPLWVVSGGAFLSAVLFK